MVAVQQQCFSVKNSVSVQKQCCSISAALQQYIRCSVAVYQLQCSSISAAVYQLQCNNISAAVYQLQCSSISDAMQQCISCYVLLYQLQWSCVSGTISRVLLCALVAPEMTHHSCKHALQLFLIAYPLYSNSWHMAFCCAVGRRAQLKALHTSDILLVVGHTEEKICYIANILTVVKRSQCVMPNTIFLTCEHVTQQNHGCCRKQFQSILVFSNHDI